MNTLKIIDEILKEARYKNAKWKDRSKCGTFDTAKETTNLSSEEKEVLDSIAKEYPHGLIRKLMSPREISIANGLVKKKYVLKGISDDKQKSIIYILADDEEKQNIMEFDIYPERYEQEMMPSYSVGNEPLY
jgi:hypothetical protein